MPKVVFTNGCFDIIHPGHVDLLNKAKALGDKQIVGFLQSKDDILQASTAQDPFKIGALAMENAIKSLKGEAVEKEIIVPGLTLSRTDPAAVAEYAKTVK